MVHGGDWGSGITEQMAIKYPGNLEGIHLTDVPWYHLLNVPSKNLTAAEKKYRYYIRTRQKIKYMSVMQ